MRPGIVRIVRCTSCFRVTQVDAHASVRPEDDAPIRDHHFVGMCSLPMNVNIGNERSEYAAHEVVDG